MSRLHDEILVAADRFDGIPFDALDVRELVEEQTARRWERGTVARQLSRMVSAGDLVITEKRKRGGRFTLHYERPKET
jgi:Ribonuclease G/E